MDSTGSNIWTVLFKCIFFAYATQQREIARANVSTVEDMCSYGSLITDILRGCDLRYNQAKVKAARNFKLGPVSATCTRRRQCGRSHQANPPRLMRNGSLGLIRTMVLQFVDIHGKDIIEHVNDATSNLPGFPVSSEPLVEPCSDRSRRRKI
jgi:hypothetical protein